MLKHLTTLELRHNGDCYLLAISPDMVLFIEEVYGDDEHVAQYALTMKGEFLASVTDQDDPEGSFVPLPLPNDSLQPTPVSPAHPLNYTGPRLRGMRAWDHIDEIVRPLPITTKMNLIDQLALDIPPLMLIGIAESHVLAQTFIQSPHLTMVCRRLRVAYALSQIQHDSENQPYDYDVLTLYIVHPYNVASDEHVINLETVFAGLPDVDLYRPMDCLAYNNHFLVADGGDTDRKSRIHIWQIVEQPE
jgi:hypothetical protein